MGTVRVVAAMAMGSMLATARRLPRAANAASAVITDAVPTHTVSVAAT